MRKNDDGQVRLRINFGSKWHYMTSVLAALLIVGLWAAPSVAQECACTPCHGTLEQVHGDFSHGATPGSGTVAIFADFSHDSAAWQTPSPQYGLEVGCVLCHTNDLVAAHGNDCATCHPSPYDTLAIWNKGCQQGGCHTFYHEDVVAAHLPFANPNADESVCLTCHNQTSYVVEQSSCMNCHASYGPGDNIPPTTTSDALAEYIGPARIKFSITDNGKVGVGRTFYELDGGTVVAAGNSVFIDTLGSHQLLFWSKDQSGNTESTPNQVFFNVLEDNIPPVTTSDAKATYLQGGTINLTATDNSTLGVKTTYYQLNGGAIQGGTKVVIPATSGIVEYTLAFWSEDWSGNVEAQNTVNFTVTSGDGTIRLVWGNSDISGSPCGGDPEASAEWIVTRGGWAAINSSTGTITNLVATGTGSCPDWSGVDDVPVPVSTTTSYYIKVIWYDSWGGYDDESLFPNIYVTDPGQIVRLSY